MHRYKSDQQKNDPPGAKFPGFREDEQQGKAYFANTGYDIEDLGMRKITRDNMYVKIGNPEVIDPRPQVC